MKQRIDLWLVQNGYFDSREKAQRAIMAGLVTLDGKPIDKPGQAATGDGRIEVASAGPQYVSRGAHKLAKGLADFGIQTAGRICLDAGASTGGFTDLLLQSGAAHVFAVDVGYGQLAWKLRQDPRVTVFERENIRFFAKEKLAQLPDLITADLSFISLELVIPVFAGVCRPDGDWVTLIKPQFEAGRENVGKKGVVRDPSVHRDVLERIARPRPELDWSVVNLTFSPLPGPEGNIEYLGHWRRIGQDLGPEFRGPDPARVVAEAWESLREKM